jgi:hypothetical protein
MISGSKEVVAYLVRKRPIAICNCSDIRILDIRLGSDGKVSRYFIRGT